MQFYFTDEEVEILKTALRYTNGATMNLDPLSCQLLNRLRNPTIFEKAKVSKIDLFSDLKPFTKFRAEINGVSKAYFWNIKCAIARFKQNKSSK